MNGDMISKSELKQYILNCFGMLTPQFGFAVNLDSLINTIDQAPAVDAVEVVRCRDCEHWITDSYWNGNPDQVRACRFAGWMCGANGYCVYGERKMDAEVKDEK